MNIKCGKCGKLYRVADAGAAGKEFTCAGCGTRLRVPASKAAAPGPRPGDAGAPASRGPTSRPAAQPNVAARPAAPARPAASASANRLVAPSAAPPLARPVPAPPPSAPPRANPAVPADDSAAFFAEDDGQPSSMTEDDPYDLQTQPLPPVGPAVSETEDAPKVKKKKRKRRSNWSKPTIGFQLNRVNGALVVIGGVLLFFGGQELVLSSKAKSEPQRMSLAELIARGPGDNIYIELSGLTPSLEDSVIEYEKSRRGGQEKLTKIWMPAVPGNAGAAPNDAPVAQGGQPFGAPAIGQDKIRGGVQIVLYRRITSEADAALLARRGTYRGMIINDIESLGSEERKLLNQGFPGTNWDRCYIFQIDRQPAGAAKKAGLLTGGAILLLAGLAWIFFVSSDD